MGKSFRNIPLPLPLGLLRRLSGVNPLIVNYHVVSDQSLPHVENLYRYRNIKTFREDLEFFRSNYRFIGLGEFLECMKNNLKLPGNSCMLTFDDGFREVYEVVAPVLEEMKITTTVFLTSDFIDNRALNHDNKKSLIIHYLKNSLADRNYSKINAILQTKDPDPETLFDTILRIPYNQRKVIDELAFELKLDFNSFLLKEKPYMTSNQVREMIGAGFTFGSHSIDHARYAELPLEEQIRQTLQSTDLITSMFGLSYRVFAFPYNDMQITGSFFDTIAEKIDASFGTQGLLKDEAPRNFQRMTVEKFNEPAYRTVAYQYKRKIIRQMLQQGKIRR